MSPYQYIDFSRLNTQELADYLVARHHAYARQLMTFLASFFNGQEGRKKKYSRMRMHYYNLSDTLSGHLHKEEHILFPFVKKMVAEQTYGKGFSLSLPIATNSVKLLQDEHDKINKLFDKLRTATDSYTAPPASPSSLLLCYAALYDLEQTYIHHVTFENSFLFPRIQAGAGTLSISNVPAAYE